MRVCVLLLALSSLSTADTVPGFYWSEAYGGSRVLPLGGSVVQGTLFSFLHPSSRDSSVQKVVFSVDGKQVNVEKKEPYDFGSSKGLDTTLYEDGVHQVVASVEYADGETESHSTSFTVANSGIFFSTDASRSFPLLLHGGAISGHIFIHALPPAGDEVKGVQFTLDGAIVNNEKVVPYDYAGSGGGLDTTALSDGAHRVQAEVLFENGESAVLTADFEVDNRAVRLQVSLGNGVEMSYLQHRDAVEGAGDLVVLLHGFPESSRSWVDQLDALEQAGYWAVAPDLRGYGQTTGWESFAADKFHLDVLAEDIKRFIDALGRTEAQVVGHDFGAGVAFNLALEYPRYVLSLCVVSVPFGPMPLPTREVQEGGFAELNSLGLQHYVQYLSSQQAVQDFNADPQTWLRYMLSTGVGAAAASFNPSEGVVFPMARVSGEPFITDPSAPTPYFFTEGEFLAEVESFRRTGFEAPSNFYYQNFLPFFDTVQKHGSTMRTMPYMFVAGEHDWVAVMFGDLLPFLEYMPGFVSKNFIGGGGHFILHEKPQEVSQLLVPFVQQATGLEWRSAPTGAAAPLAGSTLSGNVYVSSVPQERADAGAVSKVQFHLDGNLEGADEVAPYDFDTNSFSTSTLANGWHEISAVATYADGSTVRTAAAFLVHNVNVNDDNE